MIVVGIYLVAVGVFRIVRALGSEGRRGWGVGLGALEMGVGIVILSWPEARARRRSRSSSRSTMLVRGIFTIVLGIQMRSLRNEEAPDADRHVRLIRARMHGRRR